MLELEYESEDFPTGSIPNGSRLLGVTWDDILWAAVTVGRPDVFHVFQHGSASVHEAIFRWSMVRMALQQRSPRAKKLIRTDLFKQMDPSEKGAVNYFLGLLICKLFADKLLLAPWSLHLDVFRDTLNPRLLSGRSKPDMVAQSAATQQWFAFECKGRSSPPGKLDQKKAKAQAQRLVSVDGIPCRLHVGAITFFKSDALNFYWRDPEPTEPEQIILGATDFAWGAYYAPIVEVVRAFKDTVEVDPSGATIASVPSLDLVVKMHPAMAPFLLVSDWQRAKEMAATNAEEFAASGFQRDGLMVKAGSSWHTRLKHHAVDSGGENNSE